MRIFVLSFGFILSSFLMGDESPPVHWTYRAERIAPDVFRVSITARMDKGWHIYAQEQPKEAIAVPTTFTFAKSSVFVYEGGVKENGTIYHYHNDDVGIKQDQYSEKVMFTQLVKVKGTVDARLTGTIRFQACTDSRCLPPQDIPFSVMLSNANTTKK